MCSVLQAQVYTWLGATLLFLAAYAVCGTCECFSS